MKGFFATTEGKRANTSFEVAGFSALPQKWYRDMPNRGDSDRDWEG